MAKVIDVNITNVPDVIIIGDNISDLTVVVNIEFHKLDIKLEMEYMLYFFVYDVHGKLDIPVMLTNWNDSMLFPVAMENDSDDFLGLHKINVIAKQEILEIKTNMTLKLGMLDRQKSHYTKKLEAFAVLVPAIGIAAKWSKPYSSKIDY
ncbi:MAG: hypothetical protein R2783_07600 [Gelidibacter sp.]